MMERAWDDALRDHGLSHAVVIVLNHLAVSGELSQTELARLARVQPQTMSRTVERMLRDGLVSREASAVDRRRVVVRLTDAGRLAWDTVQDLERSVLPPSAETDALRAALLRVVRGSASA
jgi:MarR family transcriptional regulator, organic hydroperoxide resistance regulator